MPGSVCLPSTKFWLMRHDCAAGVAFLRARLWRDILLAELIVEFGDAASGNSDLSGSAGMRA
jgi:hypothetical protein